MIEMPVLLPDEWLNGYLDRLRGRNNCKDRQNLYQLIYRHFPKSHSSILQPLSILLNRPESEIRFQHTLVPTIRLRTETISPDYVSPKVVTRKTQYHYKFCVHCIEEDKPYLGFPYLRRSHQITGIDWCLKHQYELGVCDERVSIDLQPSTGHRGHTPLFGQHPIIQRYVDIYEGLFTCAKQLSAEYVSLVLSMQAEKLGLNQSRTKTARCLSDILVEELSGKWLFDHFPVLKKKETNKFIPSIDGVTILRYQNHAVPHYVLAAAALFENADEALNALINSTKLPLKPVRAMVKRPAAFWKSEELLEIYLRNAGQAREISDEIGGTYDQNRLNLINYGLPPLGMLSNETIHAISDFYNGTPLTEIYLRAGVNQTHITQITKHARSDFAGIFNQIKNALLINNQLRVDRIKVT